MNISEEQVQAMLEMLALTKDVEASCDDCRQQLAEFAETTLAGKSIPEGLKCIDEHLQRCGECREEFEALKAALGHDNDS